MSTEASVNDRPTIGVVIVLYQSRDVVIPCLESLIASEHKKLKIVVVDNASTDGVVGAIETWHTTAIKTANLDSNGSHTNAQETGLLMLPSIEIAKQQNGITLPKITIVCNDVNEGYAGGVNNGLRTLLLDEEISLYWVLNPDCVVSGNTPGRFVECAQENPEFGMMGCRVCYYDRKGEIQSDGGRVNLWTGMCSNLNLGKEASQTPSPKGKDIDYVSGANFLVSKTFLGHVGLMPTDYFLYYEEVAWAFKGKEFPIVFADGTTVYHHVGTSIGSATLRKRPSAFANYFNFRNRIRFISKYNRTSILLVFLYSLLKVMFLAVRFHREEATAALFGLLNLQPPDFVRDVLSDEAAELAFRRSE